MSESSQTQKMSQNQHFVTITKVDFYAQLVDSGRKHCAHLGYTSSGAMDWMAYEFANVLVGNDAGTPAIEICLGNASFYFVRDTVVAISGAPAKCSLQAHDNRIRNSGNEIEQNKAVVIPKGYTLQIQNVGQNHQQGTRVYLAVLGGYDAPRLFSSVANVKREGSGGLHRDGRALIAGDKLMRAALEPCELKPVNAKDSRINRSIARDLSSNYKSTIDTNVSLQFVPGYQWYDFEPSERHKILQSQFTTSPHNDRMGVRLSGPCIHPRQRSLYSQGLCNGAIQCAGDGQLIVMLNDRQTIGGYPVMGALCAFSRARLSQFKSGQTLSFSMVDVHQISANMAIYQRKLEQIRQMARSTQNAIKKGHVT
ncbi:biotin-dependent carboxyltransferase family protein [Ningiella sp. W23]|uniref:5-oxoprolinase subunit C family protein n=1 Tax=Ningiella sp. W23 TaxID=3023715 RepID=UPI00375660BD